MFKFKTDYIATKMLGEAKFAKQKIEELLALNFLT